MGSEKRKQISTLTISGFKSIRDRQTIHLSGLNVVLGANGSGKSSLVSFFRMLSRMTKESLGLWTVEQGGADRLLSYGIKNTSEVLASIRFGLNGYDFELVPTVDGSFAFRDEQVFFNGLYGNVWLPFGSGHREAKLPSKNSSSEYNGTRKDMISYCFESISNWKVYHFHDTSETAGVKRYCSVDDCRYLREDASNLAAFLLRLRSEHPNTYEKIIRTISLAIPFFKDFFLEARAISGGEEQINLRWMQKNSDYVLWPSQLSDGSIRFICLAVALTQPDPPSTIIIDEPELGLHPYAIALLASMLKSATARMQVIVSTQSIELVNHFEAQDLLIVERREGSSVFDRPEVDQLGAWLEEYSLGELWAKNIVGGRPTND